MRTEERGLQRRYVTFPFSRTSVVDFMFLNKFYFLLINPSSYCFVLQSRCLFVLEVLEEIMLFALITRSRLFCRFSKQADQV